MAERAEYSDGGKGFLVLDSALSNEAGIYIEVGFYLESHGFEPTPEQARDIAQRLTAWADSVTSH
ncbi:hypothetical protein [Nocardia sp. NPDC004750]